MREREQTNKQTERILKMDTKHQEEEEKNREDGQRKGGMNEWQNKMNELTIWECQNL